MVRIFNVKYEYAQTFDGRKNNQILTDNINVVAKDAMDAIGKANKKIVLPNDSYYDEELKKRVKVTFNIWRALEVEMLAEA